MVPTLGLDDDTFVLVLTGAGVSAESGVPTFRDSGGLWENHPVEDVASLPGFVRNPVLVWRFYAERRKNMAGCAPNPGHFALASLERRLGDRFLLATQNVDGLHATAGSERLVELHGNLFQSRCSFCDRPPFPDREAYPSGHVPACGRCDQRGDFGLLRPNIVWFGERLNRADLARVEAFMTTASKHRFVFLAVGTSGAVFPAAGLVDGAKKLGAQTWLVNAQPPENVRSFDTFVPGQSGVILPELLR